jgi:branched-chain amino acid transport system ATP-binding protein
MLRLEHLDVAYGDTQVLWDVSLTVEDGEAVALVGANGAGKSTLLGAVSRLVRPCAGGMWFGEKDLIRLSSEMVVSAGIAHVPQGRRLFSGLTVLQNVRLGAFLRRDQRGIRDDLERVFSLFPVLRERAGQLAGSMSGGEQQMCAIARALMTRPKLLLIDELSLGLAPIVVDQILPVLQAIHEEGTAILLVEQDVQLALENTTRAYVLETGRMALSGSSSDLLRDSRVKSAYLGV